MPESAPFPVPPRPSRRRDDAEVAQLHELVRTLSEVVGTQVRRITVLERTANDTRRLLEDLKLEDMSAKQKAALLPLTDDWVERQSEAAERAHGLEMAVRRTALLQGVIAVLMLAVTVWAIAHR